MTEAKYRIDTSRQYEEIYGVPGPPEDAINVLHRYRDAILSIDSCYNRDTLKKNVIQAVAAYPFRDRTSGEFQKCRLWEAVREIGVGAVPLLPGNVEYLQQWVRDNLSRGGFSRAEQVVPHSAVEAANRWRQWASENVLIGVLRGDNPEQHLNWIDDNRIYYMPLLKSQRRQYAVKYVGVYLPASMSDPPGVYYYYPVEEIDVVPRNEIRTPWKARKGADGDVIVYRLTDKVWCAHPVINRNRKDRGLPVREHRWTSMLALQRASTMDELLIESVPEWALYEELQARRLDFAVRAIAPRSIDPETPHGRCWFILQSIGQIKFVPPVGYVVQSTSGSCNSFPTLKGLLSWMDHAELTELSVTPR